MKIIEINPGIKKLVEANGGYCPCAVEKKPQTKCICQSFREQQCVGTCHCGRYEKVITPEDVQNIVEQLEAKLDSGTNRSGYFSLGPFLVRQIVASLQMSVKLMKENAALQDGYDAMAMDLEMRTRQVRELQEERDGS